MSTEVTVAAVAMKVVHDKEANLAKYFRFIDQAADQGARLIVFPEQSLQGYVYGVDHQFTDDEIAYHYRNAETIPGASTDRLVARARERNIYIVFGLTEVRQAAFSPLLYNSAATVGPEGVLGVFSKVHLPGDERHVFRRGDSWLVVQTPLGRLGTLICYDQMFPESTRELTLGGAEILVLCTAWPIFLRHQYDIFSKARAAENHRWYICSNQVGHCDRGDMEYYGHSRIIDPRGRVVAETGDGEEGLALAAIEVEAGIAKQRNNIFYTLHWRVPESYRLIADPSIYNPSNETQSGSGN